MPNRRRRRHRTSRPETPHAPTTRSTRGPRSASRTPRSCRQQLLRRRHVDRRATAARRWTSSIPRPARAIGTAPWMGAAETRRAIDAAAAALPGWRAKTAKERSAILRKWFELMLAQQRRPRADPDDRAGQAARGVEGRDRDRRRVHRVVRRGSEARLRRRDPDDRQRPPPRRRQAAGRRVRGDHAVEFPGVDDHAQGRAGARRRLHRRHQAGRGDAVSRRWRSPSSRIARASRPACSTSSPATRRAIGGEMCANPTVRKLSFTGSTEVGRHADEAGRADGQEDLARARRQRAVHRVRRRRSRRRGRGRDHRRSTATPDRRACAPTASSCTTGSTTRSPRSSSSA